MSFLIAILYFSLDGALAAALNRRRPGVHLISFFFLLFAGGAALLQGLVTLHLPLRLSLALIAGAKILLLLYCKKDLGQVFADADRRELGLLLGFLLVTTFLVARKGLIFWDDWSNWGLIAKRLWHTDGLPEAVVGGYFDYTLIQGFYWAAFHPPGAPFEEKLGVAITFLVYAVAMLRLVPNRSWYYPVTLIAPFAFSVENFGTTYTDGMLAAGFALLAVEIWNAIEEEADPLGIVGPLLLLLFTKPAGLYLMGIAIVGLWITILITRIPGFRGSHKEPVGFRRRALRVSAILLGVGLFKYYLVKAFLWQAGAVEAQALARSPLEAWNAGYVHAYFRAVREQIFINERFVFILPAMLLANLALLPASLRIRRTFFFFLVLIGNLIFISAASLVVFSEQELRRAASFARYLEHVYLFGLALAIESAIGIVAALRERWPALSDWPRRLLIGLIVWACVYFFGGFMYMHYKHPLLKKTVCVAKDCGEKQGRFQIISQQDSGLFWHVGRFHIFPQTDSNEWQFCPTDKNDEGHRCLPTRNRREMRARLAGADVVLLVQDDEHLKRIWPTEIPYPAELPACIDLREYR